MKKINLIAVMIILLVVTIPVCIANSICTTDSLTDSGSEFTAASCDNQETQELVCQDEEDRGFWDTYGSIVMAIVAIALIFFGGWGLAIVIAKGAWFSGIALGTALLLTGAYFSAASAIDNWGGIAASTQDSLQFYGICDGSLTVTKQSSDCDCSCTITDLTTSTSQVLQNEEEYTVTSGGAYLIVAKIEEFDSFESSASCHCTLNGYISSSNLNQTNSSLETLSDTNTSSTLVCCHTVDDVCLDNYVEDTCTAAGGTVYCSSCSEVAECQPEDGTGQGTATVSSTFASQGDTITITYYLIDATSNTTVKAIIKESGTTIKTLQLYDDGSHSDGSADDKTYANTWTIPTTVSGSITWDMEIDYGTNIVINQNVGSLLIASPQCQPLMWNNGTTDIVFASLNYADQSNFSQAANQSWALIAMSQPFSSNLNDINFFVLDYMFTSTSDIQSYANANCFTQPDIIIALDENIDSCSQSGKIVTITQQFTMNSGTTVSEVINDFCSYINNLALLNPPVTTILNADTNITSDSFTFYYRIEDEEEDVEYEILQNNVNIESGTYTGSTMNPPPVRSKVIDLTTDGVHTFKIKATDQQGVTGYSDTLTITKE